MKYYLKGVNLFFGHLKVAIMNCKKILSIISISLFLLSFGISASSIVPDLEVEFPIKYIEPTEGQIEEFKSLLEDNSPLLDPFSAQIRDLKILNPFVGYCARINAKNRSGGYGGWRYIAFVNTQGKWDYLSTGFKSMSTSINYAKLKCSSMGSYTGREKCQNNILSNENPATVWMYCGQENTFLGKDKYLNLN